MSKIMNHRLRYLLPVFVLATAVMLASLASAQMADRAELENVTKNGGLSVKPAANPFSLLDMSRVRWSHSYSVSFFSGGATSGSVGLLNSTMFYDISKSLSLSINLGIVHSGGSWGEGRQATILPGFTLDYHPSDKFRMTFMIQQYNLVLNPLVSGSSFWHNPTGLR